MSLLDKLKSSGLWLLGIIGVVAATLFGFKLRRLSTLEAQEKARSLEDEVKGLKDDIAHHRENVNFKEKLLREKIAEFKHAQRSSNSNNVDPNDAA